MPDGRGDEVYTSEQQESGYTCQQIPSAYFLNDKDGEIGKQGTAEDQNEPEYQVIEIFGPMRSF
jgi:hypothetical protein